ncbi:methyltransferase domain-containing protein [Blastopirellula sp. JC732]|uniref:Methyltransferase domain-containing protein n=1 Tax=Blastopirellula sediminis TaxID=2894196 RepID=A0A9X1SGK1_9BACT|nr:class I SAM-dependent methyltransferase [Blastopirellula sediminis]MCC9608442.1 methyltransferase domain-containing protein [Blastopirellula sediminis]MCC9628781.1 methyltransferase domain-containing protein [Blastopirellula sediminis]
MDWHSFWDVYPNRFGDGNLLRQVGKTVKGVPISESQLQSLVQDVIGKLDLQKDDFLLDLCCGNGLLTKELAARCGGAVGVDFSKPMLESANEVNSGSNIEYLLMDARNIESLTTRFGGRFTKVMMYEALAYFDEDDVANLLRSLKPLMSDDARILFASVLDSDLKWRFFNTWGRRWNYLVNIRMRGRDPGIGKWWVRRDLARICEKAGFDAQFIPQDAALHTSHYRVDVVGTLVA